ncbi:t1pks [Curvularia kusanoi]|uniref:T1pks n=1 Tax=Curvularia kusanoi TaxID=90978 RepID=A0A9P4TDD6_CURKU|nr:t1pks [Curvularia kusanoi]
MTITASNTPPRPPCSTVLLFGDATDSWVDGLDQAYSKASSTPWLRTFLEEMTATVTSEAKKCLLDRTLQDSLGHFSSLQELGERYRRVPDQFGVVQAILLHTVRASALLQWAQREPNLFTSPSSTQLVGLSGGLLSAAFVAVADDFASLYEGLLVAAKLVMRVAQVASVKSRALEEAPGTWGWAVLGASPEDLHEALESFQRSNGMVPARAKVGVIGNGWTTIIGPPSTLKQFLAHSPVVKELAKNPLTIQAGQHALEITSAEIDYMLGKDEAFLDRPIQSATQRLWGMDHPEATYRSCREMLEAVCKQILSRPLDITKVMNLVAAMLEGENSVKIFQPGVSSHATYLQTILRSTGKLVTLEDESTFKGTEGRSAMMPGRIAIIGVAGRGPECDNVDEFWNLILNQKDLCSEIPKDRFDIDEYFCTAHERGDQRCKMKIRHGCFMEKPGYFDARFFHISPREALLMDPNHRQFLMSTYEALESAGYSDGQTSHVDRQRIGSFFAQATDDWHKHTHPTLGCDSYTLQGIQRAFGPGRVAWQFKWEGPTYALDSACAGTTSAIHLACLSLLDRDIDMAVAGAANVLSWPHSFTCLDDAGILSPTGNCKTFRSDADGYCRGEFVGTVVLKRLEDAIAHNDRILGVVAASGRNHSGNASSITTSDAGAQERLFRKIMQKAQITSDQISYVEMHGTGTQTGDPAEMTAIADTFRHRRRALGPVAVGGVKANFGHSEAAAGMAELLKCIKMFQTNTIPPQAGMPSELNPKFPALADINVEIPSEAKHFNKDPDSPRRILLNNFDAAGGNACLLLEDPADVASAAHRPIDPRTCHVITVSARTRAAFVRNKDRMIKWIRANPDTKIEHLAYTTTARRMHHPFRFACAATSSQDVLDKLQADDTAVSIPSRAPPVVFMYTGQGSQYAGMGATLYETSPIFSRTVDMCAALCRAEGFPAFIDIITDPSVDLTAKAAVQIQLAIVALEMSLTAFWRSTGLEPNIVMGHSLGEYAALYAAGVLSMADVLHLVGTRGLLLQDRCEVDLPGYGWDLKDYWVTYSENNAFPRSKGRDPTPPQTEPPLSTCAQYLVHKSNSPLTEVTFRASVFDPNFLALIDNHKMQQIGLCSGSVFCDAALTVAKYALEYSGRKDVSARNLSLHDPELLAPLTRGLAGEDCELHTTAIIDKIAPHSITVSFKAISPQSSCDLGTMKVIHGDHRSLQAEWSRVSYFIEEKMERRISDSKNGFGHRLQPEVLYALFARNVEFGLPFKCIREGYISRDYQEAAASVILKHDPAGSRFTFSPYWGEALAHLAGFLVNGNPDSEPEKTFIVMGFGAVEQTVDFMPDKEYLTYTRITKIEKSVEASAQPDVLDAIISSIVEATGTDPSEFTPGTMIADLGVDSIMSIEIVSSVREKTGIELPATFVFEYPSVEDLRREFGNSETPDHPPSSESPASLNADPPAELDMDGSSTTSDSGVLIERPLSNHGPDTQAPSSIATRLEDLPLPTTRITLLQGRSGPNKTPFYMMADGTGSIATYIHLPIFKGGRPIYGVDSPFLGCASRLTPDIGIEGVAKLVVEALVKHHPTGNFIIGGFSAGSTVAYEVARQLPSAGRKVDGLLIIDLCCPRPDSGLLDEETVNRETDVGINIFGTAAAVDGLWTSTGSTRDHLRAYLFAMRNYHPPPMKIHERPAASAVIWAEKGMVNRVKDNPQAMKLLVENEIPVKAYPGFMEDPKNGPFACFIPDKTAADLGPNGWDKYVGDIICLSMDADHLDMPMPGHVRLLHEEMTKVLAQFEIAR